MDYISVPSFHTRTCAGPRVRIVNSNLRKRDLLLFQPTHYYWWRIKGAAALQINLFALSPFIIWMCLFLHNIVSLGVRPKAHIFPLHVYIASAEYRCGKRERGISFSNFSSGTKSSGMFSLQRTRNICRLKKWNWLMKKLVPLLRAQGATTFARESRARTRNRTPFVSQKDLKLNPFSLVATTAVRERFAQFIPLVEWERENQCFPLPERQSESRLIEIWGCLLFCWGDVNCFADDIGTQVTFRRRETQQLPATKLFLFNHPAIDPAAAASTRRRTTDLRLNSAAEPQTFYLFALRLPLASGRSRM